MRSGHYYAFVRTRADLWNLVNDDEVRQVSLKTALKQCAYVLFYARESSAEESNKSSTNGKQKNFEKEAHLEKETVEKETMKKDVQLNGHIVENKPAIEASALLNGVHEEDHNYNVDDLTDADFDDSLDDEGNYLDDVDEDESNSSHSLVDTNSGDFAQLFFVDFVCFHLICFLCFVFIETKMSHGLFWSVKKANFNHSRPTVTNGKHVLGYFMSNG